jgi:hypothetical protein
MNITFQNFTDDLLGDNLYLKFLFINNIDTNVISVFFPEIYNESSPFMKKVDEKIVPMPCYINFLAEKQAPELLFQSEYIYFEAYLNINVICKNVDDEWMPVVELHTNTVVNWQILLS